MCRLLLESRGHVVEALTSGERALVAFARFAPQLVIVDYALGGGMTGVQLVARLRQRYASTVPIILISAHEQMATRAFEAGIDAFITKPFVSTELLTAIDQLLAGEARHSA
ncbi:MAG: Two-component response regulator [Myxococcales bacterium]|nr:Two-component response regulator [Myxococcales bacterium]